MDKVRTPLRFRLFDERIASNEAVQRFCQDQRELIHQPLVASSAVVRDGAARRLAVILSAAHEGIVFVA